MCQYDCATAGDWCPSCDSYLGLLRRKPRHIAKCVNLTIALGAGFFLALAWQVFMPLYEGFPAARPSGWFWGEFALASLLLALGLRARGHLKEMRPRPPIAYPQDPDEATPEEEKRASSGW